MHKASHIHCEGAFALTRPNGQITRFFVWHIVRSHGDMHRVLFCALALLLVSAPAQAQLLERASSAVRDEPESSDNDGQDDSNSDNDDDGRLDRGSDTVRGQEPPRRWDSGSPYCEVASPGPVYVEADPATTMTVPPPPPDGGLVHLTTRLGLEGGVVLPADPIGVGRFGASARVQLPIGLELAARYSIFIEPRAGRTDALALGRFAIDWRLVTEEFMQFRLGGAIRHFQDRAGDLYGADIEVGLDFFPIDPLILSFEANVGFIEKALVVQARGSVGFLLGIVEITLGWNYEGLFGAQNVDLGGPMAGVRFWL